MNEALKNVIQNFAPTIASALGGPLAGGAVSALSQAIFGKPKTSPEELLTAISSASPDILLKIKEAENQFTVHMERLQIDREKLAYMDTANARQREVELKDWVTPVLAILITIGFFGMLAVVFLSNTPNEQSHAADIMLGCLSTAWIAVVSYYFGSCSSSKAKDVLIAGAKK